MDCDKRQANRKASHGTGSISRGCTQDYHHENERGGHFEQEGGHHGICRKAVLRKTVGSHIVPSRLALRDDVEHSSRHNRAGTLCNGVAGEIRRL